MGLGGGFGAGGVGGGLGGGSWGGLGGGVFCVFWGAVGHLGVCVPDTGPYFSLGIGRDSPHSEFKTLLCFFEEL